MARETTLVLVKPDGMRRGLAGEIVARFERRGLELRGARLLKIPKATAREHYAEHKGKPFFGSLVDFISSGPCSGACRERRIGDLRGAHDDGCHEPARLGAGDDSRRLRAGALGEHRARIGLEGERAARARIVLP